MDTLTHCATGAAIVTISTTMDKQIENMHATPLALLFVVAIIVSNIPDIDVIFSRNRNFLSLHRGFTHGFPITLFMSAVAGVAFMYPIAWEMDVWKYVLILLGCALIHLIMDITNHYGTQILYPFSERWVAHSFISTFDPIIFVLLGSYIGIYWGETFGQHFIDDHTLMYIFVGSLSGYYVYRIILKYSIHIRLRLKYPSAHKITMVTMIGINKYRYVVETLDRFYIGEANAVHIKLRDTSNKIKPIDPDILRILNKSEEYIAFKYFSPAYKSRIIKFEDGTFMVYLTDLRYFTSTRHFPLQVRIRVNLKTMTATAIHNGFQYTPRKFHKKELIQY